MNEGQQLQEVKAKGKIAQDKLLQKNVFTPKNAEDVKPKDIGVENQEQNKYVKMSQSLGRGIFMAGKLISQGILSVGSFIANNIQPSNQMKFNQQTKANLKQLNQWSHQAFQYTSGNIKKLINYGNQMAIQAANQNQAIKMLQEFKVIKSIKDGAITGIKVFINIYDGIVQGGDEIKDGAFKGGQQILRKKYGVEAQEALKNVAGGVNNVVKIYKLPKNSVKYIFKLKSQQKAFR